tara:strand:- start:137 stop:604 length:468 start_codon:yes stop_codon:yes gene_type:complete
MKIKMKKITVIFGAILFASIILSSCESGSKDKESTELKYSTTTDNTEIATRENLNDIYFEGMVELEAQYDGIWYLSVKIDKGELAGKTENLYFQSGMEDSNSIGHTGDANFNGSGEGEGKKVTGYIIRSIGSFENYETGGYDSKEIYRITNVNFK